MQKLTLRVCIQGKSVVQAGQCRSALRADGVIGSESRATIKSSIESPGAAPQKRLKLNTLGQSEMVRAGKSNPCSKDQAIGYLKEQRAFYVRPSMRTRFPCSMAMGLLGCLIASFSYGQDEYQAWESTQGTSIEALFQKYDGENVHLVDRDRTPRAVPLKKLSESSQSKAMRIWLDRQDTEQFRMVRQHLSGLEERPEATSRILKEFHSSIPESPYAGLWASVGYSAGSNDLIVAKQLVLQTIKRIEQQQAFLPGRHATTLASAYNNYAIISLKESGSMACAGQLISASEATPLLSPIVRHNGEQLLNLNDQSSPQLALSTGQRRRLTKAVAKSEVNTTVADISPGWFYALDVDVPAEKIGGARRISGLDSPHSALELISMGTGFVASPGLVLTSRDVVDPPSNQRVGYLTVGTNQSGQLKTLPVKTCMRTRSTTSFSSGVLTSTSWGSTIVSTRFRYFTPSVNSVEGQLVGLHVPGLDLEPMIVAKSTPAVGDSLSVLGYQRGPKIIERGLVTTQGTVQGTPQRNGEQFATHDISGGQVGAPMVDDESIVHGLVFGLPIDATKSGSRIFGGRVIHSWFNRHVPTSKLYSSKSKDLGRQTPEDSIVPIFGWGLRQSMVALGQMNDGLVGSESLMIKDTWCITCGGSSVHRCPNCVKGFISYRVKKQVAYTDVGGPVYGMVVKKKKCTTCDGRGILDCKHCRDGRY